jgi:hemerythrin-like domain-containing protein
VIRSKRRKKRRKQTFRRFFRSSIFPKRPLESREDVFISSQTNCSELLVCEGETIFSQMKAYDPIAQLIKEHEQALQQVKLLNRTTDEFIEDGFSEDRFAKILSAARYIKEEVSVHNLSEECLLFPALERHVDGPTKSLRADHKELEEANGEFEESIRRVREKPYDRTAITELVSTGKNVVRIFVNHIHKENDILFPIARKVLSKEELKSIAHRITHKVE